MLAVENESLQKILPAAVAFHHASLSLADRKIIEEGFLKGNVSIICSTSTLAVGINLPCYLVILKGTTGYTDAGLQEYSSLEVMQMLGRAGRPQYETEACAVILCLKERLSKYEKMVTGTEILESSLHQNLIEHLNAEVSLGTIDSLPSAKKWLSSTFLNVRLQQNPEYYDLNSSDAYANPDNALLQWCEKDLNLLEEAALIENSGTLRSSEYGHIMARYCIKFQTMQTLMAITSSAKVSEILNALCQATEFREHRMRQGDKTFFKDLNKANEIRYPIQVDVALPQHKVSLIIQAKLGCVTFGKEAKSKTNGGHLRQLGQDTNVVINHAKRLIRCIVDIFVQRADSVTVRSALELARSLAAGVWDGTVMQLKQIPGLGDVFTRKLAAAGIKHIEELFDTDPQRIEVILSKNPPFGLDLIKKVSEFPMLHITVQETGQKPIQGKGADIKLRCEVGFLNESVPLKYNRRSYSILFLCETSYGQLIDFRRFGPSRLQTPEQILLNPTIDRPGTKVRCHIMCDDIAGTHRYAELEIKCPLAWFPAKLPTFETPREPIDLPVPTATKPSTDDFDSEGVNDSDLLAAIQMTEQDGIVEDIDDIMAEADGTRNLRKRSLTTSSGEGESSAIREPQKLPNGKWPCQHTCKDEGKQCKHKCCLEGVAKKPAKKRQKRDDGVAVPNPRHNSKAEKGTSATKPKTQKLLTEKTLKRSGDKQSHNTAPGQQLVYSTTNPSPLLSSASSLTFVQTPPASSIKAAGENQMPPTTQRISDAFELSNVDWQAVDEIAASFEQDVAFEEDLTQYGEPSSKTLGSVRDELQKQRNAPSEKSIKRSNSSCLFLTQSRSPAKADGSFHTDSFSAMSNHVTSCPAIHDSSVIPNGMNIEWTNHLVDAEGMLTVDRHLDNSHFVQTGSYKAMKQKDNAHETAYQLQQRLEEEDQRRRWAELESDVLTYESFGKYVRIVDAID